VNSQALILRPTWLGWAVYVTDGRRLALFHGPGAHARALRYVTWLAKAGRP